VNVTSSVVPAQKNGSAEIKITLTNTGNSPWTNIRLYDILPYAGDPTPSSEGNISFVSVNAQGASANVYYTTDVQTGLPAYGKHGTADEPNLLATTPFYSGWTQTNPGSSATAIAVDFGDYVLAAGDEVAIILTFSVPNAENQTAYNQIRYAVKEANSSGTYQTNSPVSGFSTNVKMISYNGNKPSDYPVADNVVTNVPDAVSGPWTSSTDTLNVDSASPALAGYSFQGWNTQADGGGANYSIGATHTFTTPSNLALYAKWTRNVINLSYDNNAAAALTPVTAGTSGATTVSYGAIVSPAPGVPSRDGYDFTGWYETLVAANAHVADTEWDFALDKVTNPASNSAYKTFYAGWSAKKVLINFDPNGGTAGTITTKEAIYNDAVGTLPSGVNAPTREGYTFDGWATTAVATTPNFTLANIIVVEDPVTVYAVWTAKSVTVTFYNNHNVTDASIYSTGNSANTGKKFDETLSTFTDPSRTGYDFDGWFRARNGGTAWAFGTDKIATEPALGLYAQWTAKTYTLTFDKNHGDSTGYTVANPTTQAAVYDAAIGTLPADANAPTRTGYTFKGWSTTSGTSNTVDFSGTTTYSWTADKTVYAVWEVNGYTLTFDKNHSDAAGYTEASPATQAAVYATAVGAVPTGSYAPTRTGYTFKGWSTTSGAGNTVDFSGSTTYNWAADKTVYAVWEANSYTLTFSKNHSDASGYTNMNPATQAAIYDAAVGTVPTGASAPTRTGYTFKGWSTTSGAGNTVDFSGSTTYNWAADKTVYAVWEAKTYTLSFNKNHGDASGFTEANPILRSAVYNAAVGLVPAGASAPTRTGYTFQGWSTNSGAGNAVNFNSATKYTWAANKVVYAVWIINTYKVTFVDYDNTILKVQAVEHGGTASPPLDPAREGYAFGGWTPYPFTNITKDTTIRAVYNYAPPADDPESGDTDPTDSDDGDATVTPGGVYDPGESDTTLRPIEEPQEPEGAAVTISAAKEQGIPVFTVGGMDIPLAAPSGFETWSLVNVLFMLLSVLFAVYKVIQFNLRRNEAKASKAKKSKVAAGIPGSSYTIVIAILALVSILICLLTQNVAEQITIFDLQSPEFAIVFGAQLLLSRLAAKRMRQVRG
jgi:uncharacterized repeat protein (TIGR02543 family)